jgi:uncharacterized protein YbjQ (UPF0145 family)
MTGAIIKSATGAVTGFERQMLITTSEVVPGMRLVRVVGLVRGNSVRARHMGVDILAGFKNMVGGEIRDYTKLLGESREQALDRMAEQARDMGANAIIAMRFSTSMIMGGAAELLAYGTAVVLEPG